jgi:hypothetical protein
LPFAGFSAIHEKGNQRERNNDSGRETNPGSKTMRKERVEGMEGRADVAGRYWKKARPKARIGKAKVIYIAST